MTELTAERIAELRRVANSSKAQRYGLSGVLSLDEFAELMDAVEGALLGPTSLNQVITAEALRSAYYGEIAAERNRLAASLAKVRELHRSDGTKNPWCDHDGFSWPCPTIQAIGEATDG